MTTFHEIITRLGNGRRYNFHSHTQFCDGRAQMTAFAAAAAEAGFTDYGFSPHSPVPITSPCNMLADNVPVYLNEVRRMNDRYGNRTRFYASMEIDYLGPEWGPGHEYFQTLPLDYRIGSVHFVPSNEGLVDIDGRFENFQKKMARYFNNDIRKVVELFYRQSMAMVEAGGFDIIGHLDKIGHNAGTFQPGIEDEPWYRALADELVEAVIAKKLTVEINTKAWREHRRMFPAPRLLRRLVETGTTIVVNSDAHVPALIDASRNEAFAMLDKLTATVNSSRSLCDTAPCR